MASNVEEQAPRYYGLEFGIVHDNVDPEGLGRVQVIVAGILDQPGPWAPPIALPGSGSPQRGTFTVPPKGSDVGILFHRGDPERPYYVGGHYGKPASGDEVPEDVRDAPIAKRPKITAMDTEFWKMTFDDNDGQNAVRIQHKKLDLAIELDGKKGLVEIRGEASISIKSRGFLDIDAPTIRIGKRQLIKNGKPL